MKKLIVPQMVCCKLTDVPLEQLAHKGYCAALLDLDNTLALDHAVAPDKFSWQAFEKLQKAGFRVCIVSNAKSNRSAEFAKILGCSYVAFAKKPSTKGIKEALALLQVEAQQAIFVGDQIFTDIIAANRAGVYSILVEPFPGKEVFYVKLKRPLEKLVRKIWRF